MKKYVIALKDPSGETADIYMGEVRSGDRVDIITTPKFEDAIVYTEDVIDDMVESAKNLRMAIDKMWGFKAPSRIVLKQEI